MYWQAVLGIVISAIITNNIVFRQSWGICPFLGVSKKTSTSIGMGFAVIFVMGITSILTYVINQYILVPLNAVYLNSIIFIMVIASTVQLIEILLKRFSPALYNALGVYLPLITTNCAVLLIAVSNVSGGAADPFLAFLNGVFTGVGFMVALILMSGVREKNERAALPASFQGFPAALITAAIIAMAFYGLSGLKFF